ncbi:diaminobutyrate acetyltransferase [Nocardia crassostreae]|uniref:diaminobutyrate acetyltransferase n=1 Tax=Nocardia crassostreae TaxID=53428 RepID=UPI000A0688D5
MQTQFRNSHAITQQTLLPAPTKPSILVRNPLLDDGARMWRIAKDSRVLDANSSYAYLLWCRDFATTSVVAEIGGEVAGFVIGYVRPQEPGTLFVWQVAVDHAFRGRGVGVAMLDVLLESLADQGVSLLETTISPDNTASIAMFGALARRRRSAMTRTPLFTPGHFPDNHEAELLYRIAPANDQEIRR